MKGEYQKMVRISPQERQRIDLRANEEQKNQKLKIDQN